MVESEESYTESGNRKIASYLSPKGTLAIPNKKSIKSSSCLSADYNVQNATKKGIMAYKQLRRFFVIPEKMTVLSLSCFIFMARAIMKVMKIMTHIKITCYHQMTFILSIYLPLLLLLL